MEYEHSHHPGTVESTTELCLSPARDCSGFPIWLSADLTGKELIPDRLTTGSGDCFEEGLKTIEIQVWRACAGLCSPA